jgi:hypothetical protein
MEVESVDMYYNCLFSKKATASTKRPYQHRELKEASVPQLAE